MDSEKDIGKVAIIGVAESFLASSIIKKLEGSDINSIFVRADIKEIEAHLEEMELVILFMSEELDAMPETVVYLKDIICDRDIGLLVIGEDSQYDSVKKMIPEQSVTEWFDRPLDIERLVKRVCSYMDENTGEKRKKTILIVDDDITYMRTVYEWLKGKYHVGMAVSGVQAISYLARNKADLILLDYEMPIADGPQVLSMLKSDSETGQIPVVFLTGHGDRESVLSVVDLKPLDYLLKTIGKDELLEKLDKYFRELL